MMAMIRGIISRQTLTKIEQWVFWENFNMTGLDIDSKGCYINPFHPSVAML